MAANNGKKEDKRSFCFCMHSQVDCLPGVVLDCNNHKRTTCPLVEEVLAINKDKEKQVNELKEKFKKKDGKAGTKKETDTGKKNDNRAFCFCLGALVDCLPGVVLDCNNHKRTTCPLVEEVLAVNKDKEEKVHELKEKFMKKDNKSNKKTKEEDKKEESKKEDTKKKNTRKEAEVKKDNRAFCFCMGTQVNCIPGVVLDCNNRKRDICPLLLDALPFDEEQKKRVKDIDVMLDNR